jgi:tRNA threonylcarbamoyladenosine biosynthesis protein TsaB
MTILALEFSSPQRSVAIARDGILLAEASEFGGRNTTAFGMIEKILAEAKIEREEIEVIAVGLGPGSYTGIRAAIALAQGWTRSGMNFIWRHGKFQPTDARKSSR